MDPHQARLATMLNEVPVLKAIVPDYMADNNPENESAWEGRMKNAIEGMGIGLAAEGVLKLVKAYKVSSVAAKAAKATDGTPEEAVKAMGEALDAKAAAVDELVQPIQETGFKVVDDALSDAIIPPKEGDVFINMANINTSEDVKKMMQQVADSKASTLNAGGKTHAGIKEASKSEMKKVKIS